VSSLFLNNQYAGLLLHCTIEIAAESTLSCRSPRKAGLRKDQRRESACKPLISLVPAEGFDGSLLRKVIEAQPTLGRIRR
jgi:hypothetical protein